MRAKQLGGKLGWLELFVATEEYPPKLRKDDKRRERDILVRHRSKSHRRENPDER